MYIMTYGTTQSPTGASTNAKRDQTGAVDDVRRLRVVVEKPKRSPTAVEGINARLLDDSETDHNALWNRVHALANRNTTDGETEANV